VEGEVEPDVAATYLQRHANATVFLDLPAAGELTRVDTPWVLEAVEWTPVMTERAVVWLAERAGKAILKLTARDYSEHHLKPAARTPRHAGTDHGLTFTRLRDKIRAVATSLLENPCSSSRRTPMTTSSRWAACCASCERTRTPSSSPT